MTTKKKGKENQNSPGGNTNHIAMLISRRQAMLASHDISYGENIPYSAMS